MDQGSSDWHKWREQGLGASEAPAIMGESPYMTPLQLWEIKTKRRPPVETNWAMQRGVDMEPKARATWELLRGLDMPPTLAEHKDYPFIRASLDGYNKELNVALEIKCCGKKNFDLVKSGQIPLDYKAQIQQQILVTGVDKVYLWAFDGENGAEIEVKPDYVYCQTLLMELIKFWDHVKNDTAPVAGPKDFEIVSDESLFSLCSDWKKIHSELKLIEDKIKNGLQKPRVICNGVKMTKTDKIFKMSLLK